MAATTTQCGITALKVGCTVTLVAFGSGVTAGSTYWVEVNGSITTAVTADVNGYARIGLSNAIAGTDTVWFHNANNTLVGSRVGNVITITWQANVGQGCPVLSIVAGATTVTPSSGLAQINWTAATDPNCPSTTAFTYDVVRSLSSSMTSPTTVATGLTALVYTDTGLTNGTPYFYRVVARNHLQTSEGADARSSNFAVASGTPRALTENWGLSYA